MPPDLRGLSGILGSRPLTARPCRDHASPQEIERLFAFERIVYRMPSSGPGDAAADATAVEAFLAALPPPLAEVADRLRVIVRGAVPAATERIRPGWGLIGYDLPVGRRDVYVAWIWPEARSFHVHLGFEHGILFDDPAGLLEGRGVTKQVRWLTYRPGEAIDEEVARAFLLEAERHALLPGPVRQAALRERKGDA